MATVYAYGRHSTAQQGLTEEAQRQKVESYIRSQLSGHAYGGWIYDTAISGSKPLFERPQGRNLWALAQPGDHLVWARLDRAFRSVVDGASTLAMLAHKGVFVHSLDLGLDTSTAIGRCVCSVMLAFAELEREYASERTAAALRAKRDAHKPYNRTAPIGWIKMGKKKFSYYTYDPHERAVAARILELRSKGHSYDTIVDILNDDNVRRSSGHKWNRNSVRLAGLAAQAGFPKDLRAFSRRSGASAERSSG